MHIIEIGIFCHCVNTRNNIICALCWIIKRWFDVDINMFEFNLVWIMSHHVLPYGGPPDKQVDGSSHCVCKTPPISPIVTTWKGNGLSLSLNFQGNGSGAHAHLTFRFCTKEGRQQVTSSYSQTNHNHGSYSNSLSLDGNLLILLCLKYSCIWLLGEDMYRILGWTV